MTELESTLIKERVADPLFQLELYSSLVGERISNGSFRDVYECPLNNNWVTKVQIDPQGTSNMIEYFMWQDIQTHAPKSVQKWFCPLIFLSPCGRLLIAQKCDTQNIKKPTKVPHFLSDCRMENFGMLDGRLVVIDYDFTLINLIKHKMNASDKKVLKMKEWTGGSFNI